MKSNGNSLVVVTGASGFIAMHCIVELLKKGYEVRGTLRSLGRPESIRNSIASHADTSRLSFVKTDLMSDTGWNKATEGAEYVLHIASPIPREAPKHEDDLIIPAREGTLRVLRAARQSGVKRVVLTSSIAAVLYGHARDGREVYDENSWSNLEANIGAYEKSKTLAEKAAWDYVNSLPTGSLELVALNPGMVLGPLLNDDPGTSGEVVRQLLSREIPGCPDISWAMVDVRDVADAHITAMKNSKAAGERFLLANEQASSMLEIAQILNDHYQSKGFQIPTKPIPKWLMMFVSLFNRTARLALTEFGKRQDINNSKAKDILGWKTRPLEEMVVSMAESMIKYQVVSRAS